MKGLRTPWGDAEGGVWAGERGDGKEDGVGGKGGT